MNFEIVSIEQLLYLLAAVVTIVSALVTVVIYSLRRSKDPFLKYWVVMAFACGAIYWIVIHMISGPDQVEAVCIMYALFLSTIAVILVWRYIALRFYVRNHRAVRRPYGFDHGYTDYLPYFLIIIAYVLMTFWLTLYYTFDETNAQNRAVLFLYFAAFLILSGCCRVVWTVIDTSAISRLSREGLSSIRENIYGILRAVDLDHGLVIIDIGENRRIHITDVPEELHVTSVPHRKETSLYNTC
jgi:hypothetical protein